MCSSDLIKQLGEAVSLLDDNFRKEPSRIEKISNRILKAQEIITELMASLDMEAGGEIARNLFSLYGYFNQQLVQANMDKRPEGILSVKEMMEELRLAWVEVVSNTAVPTEVQSAPAGINIAG